MPKTTATYPLNYQERKDLKHCFTYHPPKDSQPERYIILRARAFGLAKLIMMETPKGREQSLALTKLEEVVFWANAAIARGE